jgi:plastocyanin
VLRRAVPLLVATTLLAASCGGDDGPEEVEGDSPVVEGAPEVVVVGTDFAFEPSVLNLNAGEAVNIVFEVSEGGHDLVVQGAGFATPIIDEGEVTRGGLVIDEPGTYEMVCLVPGHIDEGMVGTVEVE